MKNAILILGFVLFFASGFAGETNGAPMVSTRLGWGIIFPSHLRRSFGGHLSPLLSVGDWRFSSPIMLSFDFRDILVNASGGGNVQYKNYVLFANYHYGHDPFLDNYEFHQGWDTGIGILGDVNMRLRYFNGVVRTHHTNVTGHSIDLVSLRVTANLYDDFVHNISILHYSTLGRAINGTNFFYHGYFQVNGSFFIEKLFARAMVGYIQPDSIVKPEFRLQRYLWALDSGQLDGTKMAAVSVEGRYYPFELSEIPFLSSIHLFASIGSGGVLRHDQLLSAFRTRFAGSAGIGYKMGEKGMAFQLGGFLDDAAVFQIFFYFTTMAF